MDKSCGAPLLHDAITFASSNLLARAVPASTFINATYLLRQKEDATFQQIHESSQAQQWSSICQDAARSEHCTLKHFELGVFIYCTPLDPATAMNSNGDNN